MKVWRLEYDSLKPAGYRMGVYNYVPGTKMDSRKILDEFRASKNKSCPMPQDDPTFCADFHSKTGYPFMPQHQDLLAYGCISGQKLHDWFNDAKPLLKLDSHGVVTAVYNIPDRYVYVGRQQCAFPWPLHIDKNRVNIFTMGQFVSDYFK